MARPEMLALLIAFAMPVRADFKVQIQLTEGSHTTAQTAYYKPQLWRADLVDRSYLIMDSANRRSIVVEPAARQYWVHNLGGAPQQPAHPDQTIVTEIETRDTGEQRKMFGHIARHIFTTLRSHTEYRNQPPSAIQEVLTDGWYLDVPGRFPMLSRAGTVAFLTGGVRGNDVTPRIAFKTTGHSPEGLPVWEKSGDRLLEVTELSEAPLDAKLFEPPSGFRRVDRTLSAQPLSWTDLLWVRWQQFLVGLASPDLIRGF